MTDIVKNVPGEPLASIRRPEWLRWTVVVALVVIAAGIMWVVLDSGEHSGIQIILLTLASTGCLFLALAMSRARGRAVILTREGFYDDEGVFLCPLAEIERVESGFFAFKPSKGFLARLKSPAQRAWSPGLWWRIGKRFAVGGATPGRDGRAMAELLVELIAERDGKT